MSRTLITASLVLSAALAGFLGADVVNPYFSVKIDGSLTLGNILQALATIGAGLAIALYLQPRTQADRKEKEILFRQIDLLIDGVTELEKFKDGGAITEIAAALKKFSVGVKGINDILKYLKYPPGTRNHVRLDEQVRIIRKLATETPISEMEDHARCASSNKVREGIIELAAEKRALLESKLSELKMRLLKAQIAINAV